MLQLCKACDILIITNEQQNNTKIMMNKEE